MPKNLTTKTVVIVAILLLCIFGVIGFPKSRQQLLDNMRRNIRLGLDLKGGSHLVLQVQIQDAVKAEADQAIERLKEDLRKQNIDYAALDRNDPARVEDTDQIEVNIKGVPAQKTSALRSMIADQYAQWVLTPVNSTDYRLNLRPSELLAIKHDTVERSIQTIGRRINDLGLTEPVVQQYSSSGDQYQILV
ncbi:MAG TPA: hypothetical protein VG672_15280, partial [Bryobacteraceae bacterium]|nr:hypothetical protein [Bryobacteraceae bacterium]